jgi:hypothetical protein
VNPTPAAPAIIFHYPDRRYFCLHYSGCLQIAIDRKWESFTCASCTEYEPAQWDQAHLEQDSTCCRALLQVLTAPDLTKWKRKGKLGFDGAVEA